MNNKSYLPTSASRLHVTQQWSWQGDCISCQDKMSKKSCWQTPKRRKKQILEETLCVYIKKCTNAWKTSWVVGGRRAAAMHALYAKRISAMHLVNEMKETPKVSRYFWDFWLFAHCSVTNNELLLLLISDPPEIEIEQNWYQRDDQVEVELICVVHAKPKAEVRNNNFLFICLTEFCSFVWSSQESDNNLKMRSILE